MSPGEDLHWMGLALAVARRARPLPNPAVGAVVVSKDGCFVSLGWHRRAGAAHAEVVALDAAAQSARGATLYVTLEPCNHYGKTPPCVDAILTARVSRVVVGCRDPNPSVTGGGVERLRRHGVEVSLDRRADEARALIEAWTGGTAPLHPPLQHTRHEAVDDEQQPWRAFAPRRERFDRARAGRR